MSGLQGLDLAVIAVLALSMLIGLWRGLVYELMTLAGWILAYAGAMAWAPHVGRWVPIGEAGSALNHAAAVVGCFLLILVVTAVLARLLRSLLAATPLSLADRFLGAAFGLMRGVVLLLLLATVVSMTPAAQSAMWQQSRAVQWLGVVIEGLRPVLHQDISRWLVTVRQRAL